MDKHTIESKIEKYKHKIGLLEAKLEQLNNSNIDNQIVTPWVSTCSSSGFQYDRLVNEFGVQVIDNELIKRFEKATGKEVHPWIKRGIFFAHRELDKILDDYEKGLPIFIYTGRGPTTDSLHLGHMIPFIFTKWLQDVFNAIVVIQMADDEKYYFKDMEFDDVYKLGFENAKDIIACGFNPELTFIFSNRDYSASTNAHNLIHKLFSKVTSKTIKNTFGLTSDSKLGQLVWPIYQTAASYSSFYGRIFKNKARCLIVYAIDQDPYFRIGRELAESVDNYKPCALIAKFLPALEGKAKMSSTTASNSPFRPIFMTDDSSYIRSTIIKHAFSGGRETLKEHRMYGGNLDVDMSYQYLRYFEYDDTKLNYIAEEYSSGRMLSSEIKKILADKVIEIVKNHQLKRQSITDVDVKYFYDINKF